MIVPEELTETDQNELCIDRFNKLENSLVTESCRDAKEKRPLSAHETRGAMLPTQYAQKLSIKMNVELGGGEKVFGRMQTGERCGRNRRDI